MTSLSEDPVLISMVIDHELDSIIRFAKNANWTLEQLQQRLNWIWNYAN
jgi:hypothetical protein